MSLRHFLTPSPLSPSERYWPRNRVPGGWGGKWEFIHNADNVTSRNSVRSRRPGGGGGGGGELSPKMNWRGPSFHEVGHGGSMCYPTIAVLSPS